MQMSNFLNPQLWLEYLLIRVSGLFDMNYYLRTYPEVTGLPILHYIITGWREGKNPSPHFDTQYYLTQNPDIRQSGQNPLVHYIRFGKPEGRLPRQFAYKTYPRYQDWISKYDTLTRQDKRAIKQQVENLPQKPNIGIILPANPSSEIQILSTLASIQKQLYPNWTLTLILSRQNYQSANPKFRKAIENQPKIKLVTFSPDTDLNDQIIMQLNQSQQEFVTIIEPGCILREHALYMFAHEINAHPAAQVIYCDEDRLDEHGHRTDPYFKPDWNPDLLRSQNYLGNLCLFKADAVKNLTDFSPTDKDHFKWELTLDITSDLAPHLIRHIPFILCHQTDPLTENLFQLGDVFSKKINAVPSNHPPDSSPLVSIIIPTHNQKVLLERCLDTLTDKSTYTPYEVLVVDNQSDDPQTLAYLSQINNRENCSVLSYAKPFNFSAINNFAVQHSQGEVVVFLNNDIEVISPEWLTELVRHALRPEIGAVGAMLYYPDDTIQHAGLILGLGGVAGYPYQTEPHGYLGQRGRAALVQNLSAVTAACMAVEKRKFTEVGGFDQQHLSIAYNDVDLCLRLQERGYRTLWTPHAELIHHESASRGFETTPEKQARFLREVAYCEDKWSEWLENDPAYNPNLTLEIPDYSLADPPRVTPPWKD